MLGGRLWSTTCKCLFSFASIVAVVDHLTDNDALNVGVAPRVVRITRPLYLPTTLGI